MVSTKKLRNTKVFAIIILILASAGGWAFYSMLNQGAEDLLNMMGIVNSYAQSSIIVIFVIIVLVLFGVGISKAISKILE